MSPHHSDQMSQRSQVSRVALCMSNVKVLSVTQWLSDSVSDKVTCSGQQKSTQSTFIKTCEDLTAFYLFLTTDMTLFPNWSLPGRVKFSWKGELYFWQVNFMEVLLRLVRFLWLSNCPQKHNLLWEKGENLIAIEDTQSQWREEKGGKILDQKIFHKGWPRVGLFVVRSLCNGQGPIFVSIRASFMLHSWIWKHNKVHRWICNKVHSCWKHNKVNSWIWKTE